MILGANHPNSMSVINLYFGYEFFLFCLLEWDSSEVRLFVLIQEFPRQSALSFQLPKTDCLD